MSFFNELVQIGIESVKGGAIGFDDHEALKRKIKFAWEKHGGGRDQAKKKAAERNFFFYWQFTLDESYDRCMPTPEQVYEALPDELKFDDPFHKVTVEADLVKSPIQYTVAHMFKEKVNKHFEEEAKKNKREREEGNEGDAKKVKAEAKEEVKEESVVKSEK
jgi:hypothetical protein